MLNLRKETKCFFKSNKKNILKRQLMKKTEDEKWRFVKHLREHLCFLSKTQGFFTERHKNCIYPHNAIDYLKRQPKTAENYKKITFLEKAYKEAVSASRAESRECRLKIAFKFFKDN
jgi:hypothetical protein